MPAGVTALSPSDGLKPGKGKSLQTEKRKGYRKIRFKAWVPDTGDENISQLIQRASSGSRTPASVNERTASDRTQQKPTAGGSLTQRHYSHSLVQTLPKGGTRQDPFFTLPIEAKDCVPEALDYFLQIVGPDNDYGVKSCENGAVVGQNPHMQLLFPFLMKTPMVFESVVAVCRASMLLTQGKMASEDPAFLLHRHRSIQAVNAALTTSDAASDATLLTIAMLLTLEYLTGNSAAVNIHLKGLDRLAELRTDLEDGTAWHTFVKGGLDAYKTLGCFVTGGLPTAGDPTGFLAEAAADFDLNDDLYYPDLPFRPDLCQILAQLPAGLSEVCLSGNVSVQMIKILAYMTAMTSHSGSKTCDEKNLEKDLQIMLAVLRRFALKQTAPMETYISIGLVACCFLVRRLQPLNLFHDPPLQLFIRMLSRQTRPDSPREANCMVWISMCAAGALALRTVRAPGSHLVLDKVFELCPVTRTWSGTKKVLKKFLWTEALGQHWQKCWETGKRRWDHLEAIRQTEQPLLSSLQPSPVENDSPMETEFTMEQMVVHARALPSDVVSAMKAAGCPVAHVFSRADD